MYEALRNYSQNHQINFKTKRVYEEADKFGISRLNW